MEFVILLIVAIVVIIQHDLHKNDPLKREIQFYKNRIKDYVKKIEEYQQHIKNCETSNSGLLSSPYFKESRIRSFRESIEDAQKHIEWNKERLQEKQKELNKLEGRREDDNGKEDKNDPLKKEIQFYKNRIEYYETELKKYKEFIEYYETSNNDLWSSPYFKESRIRSFNESIKDAQKDIEWNKERLQEKQKELNKLEGREEDDNGKEDKGD